jgi:hypothetical protein
MKGTRLEAIDISDRLATDFYRNSSFVVLVVWLGVTAHPQCGMACPSADRGLRLRLASTLLDPRLRRRVWRCLHPAHPGYGHSRPTGLGAVALAERICRG